jgi:hypothetical protein
MERTDILNWLNRRLLTNMIDDHDVIFIRQYIYHYNKTNVDMNSIVESIKNSTPQRISNIFEFMTNKLVTDFKINAELENSPINVQVFENFMGSKMSKDSKRIIKYY